MTKAEARQIERIADRVDPENAAELRALTKRLARRPGGGKPEIERAKERKAASKEERRAKVAAIREAAHHAAQGLCAVCRSSLLERWHLHHARGGGQRRTAESVENCAPLCESCHHDVHRGDLDVLDALHNYFIVRHYTDGAFAVGRRMTKIEEARSGARAAARRSA